LSHEHTHIAFFADHDEDDELSVKYVKHPPVSQGNFRGAYLTYSISGVGSPVKKMQLRKKLPTGPGTKEIHTTLSGALLFGVGFSYTYFLS